jgi:hypothetical protein
LRQKARTKSKDKEEQRLNTVYECSVDHGLSTVDSSP